MDFSERRALLPPKAARRTYTTKTALQESFVFHFHSHFGSSVRFFCSFELFIGSKVFRWISLKMVLCFVLKVCLRMFLVNSHIF